MEVERMMKEKRVLVAVDESKESMDALSWCLSNLFSSRNSRNTLLLLYVKPPPLLYSSSFDASAYLFGDGVAAMEKHGKELANSVMGRAEAIYRDFDMDINVEKKVGSGDPKDVICMAVDKLGADVLVMGSHDYGFFKRALLGSVSDYCTKNARCPVVVVKQQQQLHPKNIIEF